MLLACWLFAVVSNNHCVFSAKPPFWAAFFCTQLSATPSVNLGLILDRFQIGFAELILYSATMTLNLKTVVYLLAVLLFPLSIPAVSPENPYHTILDRNPFGLNPPPAVSTNTPVEPPRNIKFNGITYVGGKRKAFFTIPGKDPKDPLQYVTLGENESTDILEVTEIRKEVGEVDVVNSGIKMVLSFKNNGNKGMPGTSPIAAAAPVPIPAALSPVYASAGNNPVVAGQTGFNRAGESTSFQPNSLSPNPVVYNGGVVRSQISGRMSASGQESAIDPVQERMNMLAQHAIATAASERNDPITVYKPQTDAKVYSPGGVAVTRRPPPPPPPLPPAPPGLSAQTGE